MVRVSRFAWWPFGLVSATWMLVVWTQPATSQTCTIQRLCNSGSAPYTCRPLPADPAVFTPEAGYRAKDFALIKKDGWYHLFYIRVSNTAPDDETQKDFGHARSQNLYDWQILDPVLPVRPDKWDNFMVWAPYIVKVGDTYNMFYTGVTNGGGFNRHQRIGLATSTNLTDWARLDAPVFECADVPWTYCAPGASSGGEFRDPFVMPDPAVQGRWLMYLGAGLSPSPYKMRPELAVSNGDFTQWEDSGSLWSVHDWWTDTNVLESPHLFSHGSRWFILFTSDSGQPLSIVNTTGAPSDTGSVWTDFNRLANLDCVNAEGMVGSEYLKDDNSDEYFANYYGSIIQIRQMGWDTGDPYFTLRTPVHVANNNGLAWNGTSVYEGDAIQLSITTVGNFAGRSAKLELYEVDDGGTWDPIPPSTLGLPETATLAGVTTVLSGTAHRIADSDDSTPDVSEYVVRYLGETQVLHVNPVPCCYDPPLPDDPPIIRPPHHGSREHTPSADTGLPLSLVTRGSSSGPLSWVIDLPSAARVRLDLYDVRGRRMVRVADRELPAGETVLPWSSTRLAPGAYFSRLTTPFGARSVRVVLAE
jgi:sucrose-6-phosphate hydrolase SacC (GH32 family)